MMIAKHYVALFFTAALAQVGYAIPELVKKRALAHAKNHAQNLASKHSKGSRNLEDAKRLLAEGCESANGDAQNPLFTTLLNPTTFEAQFDGAMKCTCVETDQRTGMDCEFCDGNDYCATVDGEEFCLGFSFGISITSSLDLVVSSCFDAKFDESIDGELCVEITSNGITETETCEATFEGTACASCTFANCTDTSMTMTGGEPETGVSVDCAAAGGPSYNECDEDDDSPFTVGNPTEGSVVADDATFTCSTVGGGGGGGSGANLARAFNMFAMMAAGALAVLYW